MELVRITKIDNEPVDMVAMHINDSIFVRLNEYEDFVYLIDFTLNVECFYNVEWTLLNNVPEEMNSWTHLGQTVRMVVDEIEQWIEENEAVVFD